MSLGNVLLQRGRPHDARAVLEQSVAIDAGIDGIPDSESVARFRVAKAVVSGGDSLGEARVLAERSRADSLTRGGGVAAQVAETDKWLADHATAARRRR